MEKESAAAPAPPPPPPQPLSIVVVIKNRTCFDAPFPGGGSKRLRLFEHNVDSLIRTFNPTADVCWELVVIDFHSSDVDMQEFLQRKFCNAHLKFTYKLHTMHDPLFCKGKGLNVASAIASHPWIFFLDADMKVTDRQLFDLAYQELRQNKVFFPVCMSYSDHEHKTAKARPTGTGNVFISASHLKMKPWKENKTWGDEDINFHKFFQQKKLATRALVATFFHQWHPNTYAWKNKFYKTKT